MEHGFFQTGFKFHEIWPLFLALIRLKSCLSDTAINIAKTVL